MSVILVRKLILYQLLFILVILADLVFQDITESLAVAIIVLYLLFQSGKQVWSLIKWEVSE